MASLNHIALVPDGNRRWAKKNGKTTIEGHTAGAQNIERFIDNCFELGIPQVTIWLLSTENLNRSKEEVETLFKLGESYFDKLWDRMDELGTKVKFYGDLEKLPPKITQKMRKIEERTSKNIKRRLNILVAYGGRFEIREAFNKLIASGKRNVAEGDIMENLFITEDVDLVVRTGEHRRLSGLLPFQTTYSELYFTDTLWPDFKKSELVKAIKWFDSVKRNFGK